jgi:hypothetical protein
MSHATYGDIIFTPAVASLDERLPACLTPPGQALEVRVVMFATDLLDTSASPARAPVPSS